MKKIQLVIIFTLCVLLTACSGEKAPAVTTAPTAAPTQAAETTAPETTAPETTISETIVAENENEHAVESAQAAAPVDTGVKSIQVKELPSKTSYFLKEKFSAEGGVLLVTYEDGTTAEISMTADGVMLDAPSTAKKGSKNVSIVFGGKKTKFKIKVVEKGMTVTFLLNDENSSVIEQNVTKGYTALKEIPPEREGFTFENWYADETCTVMFDFDQIIEADTSVYAKWLDNNVTYHRVCFDMNYYGCALKEYPQMVADGAQALFPAISPERVDYTFKGWYQDAAGEKAYAVDTAVSEDLTVYACWEKAKSGVSTYVFEAEDVDLSQKAGPGYSGENAGIGMIVTNTETGASNNKFVAYQCKYGNSLEFNVACDADTEDAVLYVTLAAEFSSMTLTPDTYEISVNGTPLSYGKIVLELAENSQQGAFADFSLGNISLKQGGNLIQLKTINNNALGGTLTATAPIIDCIKVETGDVVIWDGTCGLPQSNY